MENSKKPKIKAAVQENESIMKHVVELTERMGYVVDALKGQAEVLKVHGSLLDRVRSRMGL